MAETLKQEATKLLEDVPGEYLFWCCTGCILHNMRELGDELKIMSDESYAYHANGEKNDFSNWVRDIIKDDRLSRDLLKALNRAQATRLVVNRVSILAKRLN
jgi:hypothetical protein